MEPPNPAAKAFQLPSNLPPLGVAAGLLALAELPTLATRTALAGIPSWWDALFICPGFHRQLRDAPRLHDNEYPAVAALTTGYVFRVENPATVFFLQRIGRTGALTHLAVSPPGPRSASWIASPASTLLPPTLTVLTLAHHLATPDPTAAVVLLLFILSRALSTLVLRRRSQSADWHGAPEPGVHGDLLVLLSQDRWVRLRGPVDDLKAVTSGAWLRAPPTVLEAAAESLATMLAYVAAGLSLGTGEASKWLLIALLVVSAGVLGLENWFKQELKMHGRVVKVDESRGQSGVKVYKRRLELVDDLLGEEDRVDGAMRRGLVGMGMMAAEYADSAGRTGAGRDGGGGGTVPQGGPVIM